MQIPDLASLLPGQLYQTDSTIGMPDAGDWDGIYVQVRQQGVTRWWLIDKAEGNLPDWPSLQTGGECHRKSCPDIQPFRYP